MAHVPSIWLLMVLVIVSIPLLPLCLVLAHCVWWCVPMEEVSDVWLPSHPCGNTKDDSPSIWSVRGQPSSWSDEWWSGLQTGLMFLSYFLIRLKPAQKVFLVLNLSFTLHAKLLDSRYMKCSSCFDLSRWWGKPWGGLFVCQLYEACRAPCRSVSIWIHHARSS